MPKSRNRGTKHPDNPERRMNLQARRREYRKNKNKRNKNHEPKNVSILHE